LVWGSQLELGERSRKRAKLNRQKSWGVERLEKKRGYVRRKVARERRNRPGLQNFTKKKNTKKKVRD